MEVHPTSSSPFAPSLTKDGYWTLPFFSQIRGMPEERLRCLGQFCIGNSFGSIFYPDEVDITFCNLDEIFFIEKDQVNVYPEKSFPKGKKPPAGKKLNKTAMITFFQSPLLQTIKELELSFPDQERLAISKLSAFAFAQKFELKNVDLNKNQWEIAVPHFTRYGAFEFEEGEEVENDDNKENRNNNGSVEAEDSSKFDNPYRENNSETDLIETTSSLHVNQKRTRILGERSTDPANENAEPSDPGSFKRASLPSKGQPKYKMGVILEEPESVHGTMIKKRMLSDERTEIAYIEKRSSGSMALNPQVNKDARMSNSSEKGKEPFDESASSIRYPNSEEIQSNSLNIFFRTKAFEDKLNQGSVSIRNSNEILYRAQKNRFEQYSEEFKRNSYYYEEGPVSAQDEQGYLQSIIRRRARSNNSSNPNIPSIQRKLNGLYEKLYKAANAKCEEIESERDNLSRGIQDNLAERVNHGERRYYLNKSFRVGWTKNGFSTVRGERMIGIHSINTYKKSFKNLEPLFKVANEGTDCLPSQVFSTEVNQIFFRLPFRTPPYVQSEKQLLSRTFDLHKQMEEMHIEANSRCEAVGNISDSFCSFAQFNPFLINYFKDAFNLIDADERFRKYSSLLQEEFLFWALVNALFGNPFCDLLGLVSKMRIYSHRRENVVINQASFQGDLNPKILEKKRKSLVSQWTKAKVEKLVNEDFKKLHSTVGGASETSLIMNFLSGGCISKSSYEANIKGAHEISLMITAIRDEFNKKYSEEGIKSMHSRSDSPENNRFYPIFQILSGNTEPFKSEKINANLAKIIKKWQDMDWLRRFGCQIWYHLEEKVTLTQAISYFFKNLSNFSLADRNVASYARIFLAHFCKFTDPSISGLGNSEEGKYQNFKDVFCFEKHDHKHKWMLFKLLKENRLLDPELLKSNVRDFELRLLAKLCFQCETMRLWDIAIQLILATEEDVLPGERKMALIRELIHRNFWKSRSSVLGRSKRKEIRRFCEQRLNINPFFFEEAKSFAYLHQRQDAKAIKHLARCNKPQILHNLFMEKHAPKILILYGQESESDPILHTLLKISSRLNEDKFKITNWKAGGKYVTKFIKYFILEIEKKDKPDRDWVSIIIRALRFFVAKNDIGMYYKTMLVQKLVKKALMSIGSTVQCLKPYRLHRANIKLQVDLIVSVQKEMESYGLISSCDSSLQNELKDLGAKILNLSYVSY